MLSMLVFKALAAFAICVFSAATAGMMLNTEERMTARRYLKYVLDAKLRGRPSGLLPTRRDPIR